MVARGMSATALSARRKSWPMSSASARVMTSSGASATGTRRCRRPPAKIRSPPVTTTAPGGSSRSDVGGALELAQQLRGEGVDLRVVEADDGDAVVAALDADQGGLGHGADATTAARATRERQASRRGAVGGRPGVDGRGSPRRRSAPRAPVAGGGLAPARAAARRHDARQLVARRARAARSSVAGRARGARGGAPTAAHSSSTPVAGRGRRWRRRAAASPPASVRSSIRSRSRRVSSGPGRSALLTTNTSAISSSPALLAWTASPQPGFTTTTVVSAAPATSTSTWPTPTVSISTHGQPTASSDPDGLGRGERQPAEVAAGGHRPDEHAVVGGVVAHADPVAEDGAAREGRRRVDGQHGDRVAVGADPPDERVGERGLAGPGGAGDARPCRPARRAGGRSRPTPGPPRRPRSTSESSRASAARSPARARVEQVSGIVGHAGADATGSLRARRGCRRGGSPRR